MPTPPPDEEYVDPIETSGQFEGDILLSPLQVTYFNINAFINKVNIIKFQISETLFLEVNCRIRIHEKLHTSKSRPVIQKNKTLFWR